MNSIDAAVARVVPLVQSGPANASLPSLPAVVAPAAPIETKVTGQ